MEINKCKMTHDDFAEKIITMVGEANQTSGDVSQSLEEFKDY
jgi:hypothetical protein